MQLFTDNYGPSKIDVQKAKVRFTLFADIHFFVNLKGYSNSSQLTKFS